MTASANSGFPLDDVLDLSTALGLADAKTELLSEYKLKYSHDYAPDGIRSVNYEVGQLHQLRTRLMDLQARREAESSALRSRRCPDRLVAGRASNQAWYAAVPPCRVVVPAE